jgi:hypothetical protein
MMPYLFTLHFALDAFHGCDGCLYFFLVIDDVVLGTLEACFYMQPC